MISEDELRYYKQLDERQRRLYLGMKAKSMNFPVISIDTKKKEMRSDRSSWNL